VLWSNNLRRVRPWVGDNVKIQIDVELVKKKA